MLKSEKSYRVAVGAVLGGVFLFFSSKGPVMRGDTPEYLRYSYFHAPLYSLILMSFNAVAGPVGLYAVSVLQIACILAASLHFTLFLRRDHNLNRILSATALAVLISPLWFDCRNYLLADSFAYCFFLMFMSHLGRWLSSPDRKEYVPAGIYLVLARLIRSDMIFLCLPYAAAGAYIYWHSRDRALLKKASIVLAATFLAAEILVRTCNLIFAGHFSQESLLGISELDSLVYVSDVGDAKLYQDGPYYDVMRRMLEEADKQKYLSKYKFALDQTLSTHNADVYGQLFAVVLTEWANFVGKGKNFLSWKDIPRGYLPAVDRFCLAASRPLLRANGRHFARLVLSRLWKGLSFYEGVVALALVALPFVLTAEPLTVLVALFSLSHLSHTFLVAILTVMLV